MYNPQLDTFVCVADCESFSKAAELLYITPTAVIKQINLLEGRLGVELFVRTHRGLTLTKAGASLYNDAKYIIQYSKESVIRAKNAMQSNDNIIRIGTSIMTPCQFLIELWPKIHAICPDLKFELVSFENTPENAREILGNLGKKIDVVLGIFDNVMLDLRKCAALEISREPICLALSVNHRLSKKRKLNYKDLFGENLLLINRNWNGYVDDLRDDIWKNYPQVGIKDFSFYDVNIFNQCESGKDLLMVVKKWQNIHPLLKIMPVQWNHVIPYGILHNPNPSKTVKMFLEAVKQALNIK